MSQLGRFYQLFTTSGRSPLQRWLMRLSHKINSHFQYHSKLITNVDRPRQDDNARAYSCHKVHVIDLELRKIYKYLCFDFLLGFRVNLGFVAISCCFSTIEMLCLPFSDCLHVVVLFHSHCFQLLNSLKNISATWKTSQTSQWLSNEWMFFLEFTFVTQRSCNTFTFEERWAKSMWSSWSRAQTKRFHNKHDWGREVSALALIDCKEENIIRIKRSTKLYGSFEQKLLIFIIVTCLQA